MVGNRGAKDYFYNSLFFCGGNREEYPKIRVRFDQGFYFVFR